jgi:hypothetical protein
MEKDSIKVLTVAIGKNERITPLIKSLDANHVPIQILGKRHRWKGMGTKTYLLKDFLENCSSSYFLFIDAYDVLFLNNLAHVEKIYEENWLNQIVFAAEKFCYPDIDLCDKYPEVDSPWRYLNAGCYIAPVDKFLKLIASYPIDQMINDQAYFTKIFFETKDIVLDTECKLFQCLNFEFEGEFEFCETFKNTRMNTQPCIIHGNGNTPMDRFYKYVS